MTLFSTKKKSLRAQYVLDKFISMAHGGDFLEIGCGKGGHSEHVKTHGIFDSHTCIDLNDGHKSDSHIVGNFEQYQFDRQFDAIWTSHVLEHTRNPGLFLDKVHSVLKEGGLLALNIPPLRQRITTGHVTMWNPGVLMLNMIRAGFDCSQVQIKLQGYNIGLILHKKTCPPSYSFDPAAPNSDRQFLPEGIRWFRKRSINTWYFKGNFRSLNW